MFFDGVRDYIVMHYQLNQRSDSEYWIANRENNNLSPELRGILKTWDCTTDFNRLLTKRANSLIYLQPSWYCILAGMGRFPERSSSNISNMTGTSAEKVNAYCELMTQKFIAHNEQLKNIYGDAWPNPH